MNLDELGRRLLAKDATLWPGSGIDNRLGWLSVIEPMRKEVRALKAFADEVRQAGFRRALLLGMGGSSLCPEVLRSVFGVAPGYLDLRVLDSTVPAAVRAAEAWSKQEQTLFIVASKSGTTVEIQSFHKYFHGPGDRFIAITDPGTALDKLARAENFRKVFVNPPDIGGRYSALSYFGLVPAALLGVDVDRMLANASRQADNGVRLGGLINEALQLERDKLTLVLAPEFASLGSWIEQLVAESTGKDGAGVLPVDGEPVGARAVYGTDRIFACIGCEETSQKLARAGLSVMRFGLPDLWSVGAEFYRWEVATAAAGALIGVNPFDEPNVTESKDLTRSMLTGTFPEESPVVEERGIHLYADPTLTVRGGLRDWLAAHLARARAGDYVAWLAYLHRTDPIDRAIQAMRLAVRDRTKLATTVGYGPRYLHSTGQYHKGGPNTGVFVMITADDGAELPIPGESYGFARLKQAQAVGDFHALARRERRIVRCHLTGDIAEGLAALKECLVG